MSSESTAVDRLSVASADRGRCLHSRLDAFVRTAVGAIETLGPSALAREAPRPLPTRGAVAKAAGIF